MNYIVVWAVMGLVSGVLAKIIMPGKDKGGLLTTTLLGVGGAFLGGYLGAYFGFATMGNAVTWATFVMAVAGALVILAAFRVLRVLI